MSTKKLKRISVIMLAAALCLSAVGCSKAEDESGSAAATTRAAPSAVASNAVSTTLLDTSQLFSDRDLKQAVELTNAVRMKLESNQDVTLDQEGVYVISGEAHNATVVVDAAKDAKVQIVLDGVSITNEDSPAIYVKAADKVFVTSTSSENHMTVYGNYTADGSTNLDAVIFSRADLVLNGTGTLDIVSNEGNGISSKDDLTITGGTYTIHSSADAIEANDSILIHDGTVSIDSDKDALHSENDEDDTLGYIYMEGGTLNITAANNAIRANRFVQIDGGIINIESCKEGIEANVVKINDGQIKMFAMDDGINASFKVKSNVVIEVNGGTIDVRMDSGDTDAFDSNGDIYINGGTIRIEASSAFDADGTAQLIGGDVTVNGEKITEITQSHPGGRGKRA
ncbi:carbohydrate-binding domain-containing protein [Paenibacillus xylaniclasticus]|uniref:carbohydrate-binding domain-containing protein n=1 Tax=Paenibacillus xylaniclasticus TaxID=588083 RepID=UPI000FDBDB47|nr:MULTISPECIES: carbohydrate-binding domain-containing protein [Paenibacillus]GFN33149.1 hypothetical protein PCURB6_34090 [Paenibacillus curdlanolyticus]